MTIEQKAEAKRRIIQQMVRERNVVSVLAERTAVFDELKESVETAMANAFEIIERYRPKDGRTPVKGKDYFTKDEVSEIIDITVAMATDAVSKIVPAASAIAEMVLPMVKVPKPRDGRDATREQIMTAVVSALPGAIIQCIDTESIAERASRMVKTEDLDIDELAKRLNEGKKIKVGQDDIEGLTQTIRSMWNQVGKGKGYLHGGGDTVRAGTNITITRNSDGTVTISSSGGGGTVLDATGTVDDTNKDFTFVQKPVIIYVNGLGYRDGSTVGGTVAWTWNGATLTATLASPVGTGGDIYGTA